MSEVTAASSLERRKQLAIEAVAAACAVTRTVQRELASIQGVSKDDKSPVTVADFAAQAVVNHVLSQSTQSGGPGLLMVGEESAAILRDPSNRALLDQVVQAVRLTWPNAAPSDVLHAIDLGGHDATASAYWTLDPVDGTKGFLRNGQYALALAWIEGGLVKVGVMGCPNLSLDFRRDFNDPDPHGVIFAAVKGGGATMMSASQPEGGAAAIRASGAKGASGNQGPIRVCESVESGHTRHDDTARIVERLGGAGTPARLDSQAKYGVVARGQADAYLRLPTKPGYVEKIWDHAAGSLVATEAGAVVTDIDGKPLDFSRGTGLSANRGVVCAGPGFHGRIIEAIAALGLHPQR